MAPLRDPHADLKKLKTEVDIKYIGFRALDLNNSIIRLQKTASPKSDFSGGYTDFLCYARASVDEGRARESPKRIFAGAIPDCWRILRGTADHARSSQTRWIRACWTST